MKKKSKGGTLVNTSYFGGLNSLLSGRRRNEGGNKKHYDISKLEAAEKKSKVLSTSRDIGDKPSND